jgi:large subunit ribosomal protein L31
LTGISLSAALRSFRNPHDHSGHSEESLFEKQIFHCIQDTKDKKELIEILRNNKNKNLWILHKYVYLCSPIIIQDRIENTIHMKKGIHPDNYRLVAFKDMSNGQVFLTKSTIQTKETEVVDGKEYPVVKLEISSSSHPFYTGKMKLVDTAGRVDKFMNRYQKHMDARKK